jgi:hypothetical protein
VWNVRLTGDVRRRGHGERVRRRDLAGVRDGVCAGELPHVCDGDGCLEWGAQLDLYEWELRQLRFVCELRAGGERVPVGSRVER